MILYKNIDDSFWLIGSIGEILQNVNENDFSRDKKNEQYFAIDI